MAPRAPWKNQDGAFSREDFEPGFVKETFLLKPGKSFLSPAINSRDPDPGVSLLRNCPSHGLNPLLWDLLKISCNLEISRVS